MCIKHISIETSHISSAQKPESSGSRLDSVKFKLTESNELLGAKLTFARPRMRKALDLIPSTKEKKMQASNEVNIIIQIKL